MAKDMINKQLGDFVLRFNKDFHYFMDDKNERREIFDKWIKLANEEAEEVQPYARLTVCSYIVGQALWGEDKEIAYYMAVAIEDIDFAADTDYDPRGDRFIPILHISGIRHRMFLRALVRELTQDQVIAYLDAVVDSHDEETRFVYALNSMLYALSAYVDMEQCEYAVQLGESILDIYVSHEPDYDCYDRDTDDILEKICLEIYKAHEQLGTASDDMIEALEESRKDPEEEERKKEAAEKEATRIGLMSEAETCRAEGDRQEYCNKMSKASEERVFLYKEMEILGEKWILDRVAKCCKGVLTELERQKNSAINNELLGHITSEAEQTFKRALDGSHPMNFVVGTDEIPSWRKRSTAMYEAKACSCPDIQSDENGCLKLSSSEAKFTFCDFEYSEVETDFSTFSALCLTVFDITNSYGELPENCKKLPDATKSERGITYDFSFVFDNEGKLIYVRSYCNNECGEKFDNSRWTDPLYNAGERNDDTLEAAEAYKRQFALEFTSFLSDAYRTSLDISYIYKKLYGEVSDEPELVKSYQREYDSANRYQEKINALEKMRTVKFKFPEVDYPDTNDLSQEISNLKPLADRENWENHLR